MNEAVEYNPLDYANLTRNRVQELMTRGPFPLPLTVPFTGAGVYALFYAGDFCPMRPSALPTPRARSTWVRRFRRAGARAQRLA